MKPKIALICTVLFALVAANANAAPQVGDKAPPIKVAKWLNNTPSAMPGEKGAEKHVYLVEFWATWCAPCRVSIPHLAELHKKHHKDGLVILGISNEEPETIKAFLAMESKDPKTGKTTKIDMPYYVGADDDMATQAIWLKDIPGIPHAFIVDREGFVVWNGNPLDADAQMDDTLEKVLAGTYDVTAAKKKAQTQKRYAELYGDLDSAYRMRDEEKVFKTLDEMITVDPTELHAYFIKRQLLRAFGRADEVAAWNMKTLEAFKDSPADLRNIVVEEVARPIEERDTDMLVQAATNAVAAAKKKNTDALLVIALVQHECGMLDEAIKSQEAALDAAAEEAKEEIAATLEYYRSLKKMAEKHKLKTVASD